MYGPTSLITAGVLHLCANQSPKCHITEQILFVLFQILRGIFSVLTRWQKNTTLITDLKHSPTFAAECQVYGNTSPFTKKLFSFSASCKSQAKMERFFMLLTRKFGSKDACVLHFLSREYQQTEKNTSLMRKSISVYARVMLKVDLNHF